MVLSLSEAEAYGSGAAVTVIILLSFYKKIKDSGYLDILKEVLHQDNDSVLKKLSFNDDEMAILEEYARDDQGKIDTTKLKSIIETYEKINRILKKNENLCKKNPDKALNDIFKIINESKK
jgi:hypothetical protein